MAPTTNSTRIRALHGAYGLLYLFATSAGVYGWFKPDGQVHDLYGEAGNRVMLVLLITGGVLGVCAYLFHLLRLELLGAPIITCAVAMIAPALFYAEVIHRQTAWYGWCSVMLGISFTARWVDVRNAIELTHKARYEGRRRAAR